jgi:rubrerythrin
MLTFSSQIAAAHEVLRDPVKRRQYDIYYEATFEHRPFTKEPIWGCPTAGESVYEDVWEPRERHREWGPHACPEQPYRPYFNSPKPPKPQHPQAEAASKSETETETREGPGNSRRREAHKPEPSPELDEIARLRGVKQERIATWPTTKLAIRRPLKKLKDEIAELMSDIQCLERLLEINMSMPNATRKYEPDGWWEGTTCSDAESETNKAEAARMDRRRVQELQDELCLERSKLEAKERTLKSERDAIRAYKEQIEEANQRDEKAIRQIQKRIRRKLADAREHAERGDVKRTNCRKSLRDPSKFCLHRGWWPKVREVTTCPLCLDVRKHLIQCPGCDMLACVACQSAIRPHSWAFRKPPGEAVPKWAQFLEGAQYVPERTSIEPRITIISYEEVHARRLQAEQRAQLEEARAAREVMYGANENGIFSSLVTNVTRAITSLLPATRAEIEFHSAVEE